MDISIKLIEAKDIPQLVEAFADSIWRRVEASLFEGYLGEQERGERTVLLAYADNEFSGFVTVQWQSDYPTFDEKGIPEVNDLRVLPAFRRRGIASALVDEAEKRIFERSAFSGIGVGMYADYFFMSPPASNFCLTKNLC